jgi:hypothetical protein
MVVMKVEEMRVALNHGSHAIVDDPAVRDPLENSAV